MNQPQEQAPGEENRREDHCAAEPIRAEVRSAMLTVLVGAEGMSEMQDAPWWRESSDVEKDAFLAFYNISEDTYREWLVDRNGRPYWLVTLLKDAPKQATEKTQNYARVLRLIE